MTTLLSNKQDKGILANGVILIATLVPPVSGPIAGWIELRTFYIKMNLWLFKVTVPGHWDGDVIRVVAHEVPARQTPVSKHQPHSVVVVDWHVSHFVESVQSIYRSV